jgi:TolB-like protein/Tfp pilus assembly protein PilF
MQVDGPNRGGQAGAIFLSYASQDHEAAQRICSALRAAGLEVWFDRSELRGGEVWDRQIREQIQNCRLFIAVISSNTEARDEGYFRREWGFAVERTRDMAERKPFIVPVVIDDTREQSPSVPEKFNLIQWTRLPGGRATPGFAARMATLLAAGEPSSPKSPASTPVSAPKQRAANRRTPWFALGVAGILAAIAGGYYAWRETRLHPPPPPGKVVPQTPRVAESVVPERSVAVLPFVDMSESHDQEYFSEGLSEEIIDKLVQVPDLKVPARTSSFYFKGKQVTVAEIARALGVAHVLEGSVRRSKDRLRVTVQLVRADTGYHLWSQTFDRDITDLFKTQDDIAAAVAKELTGTLMATTGEAATPSRIEAYALLRHGRAYADRGNKADNEKAKEYYRRALALEPNYALALAWLGGAFQNGVVNDWGPRKDGCEAARPYGELAVQLEPTLAEAQITRGNFFFDCTSDWSSADAHFSAAVTLAPHSARALTYRGAFLHEALGRHEEAARLLEEAVVLDPLRFSSRQELVMSLAALGRLDEAEHQANLALSLDPNRPYFHALLGRIELQRGRAPSALSQCAAEPDFDGRTSCVAHARFSLGDIAEADRALADLIAHSANDDATTIAEVYALRGSPEQALKWLARAFSNSENSAGSWIGDSMLVRLPDYPRYEAFIRETWKLPSTATTRRN